MSTNRDIRDYLLDIRDAVNDIRAFVAGMTFDEFLKDRKTIHEEISRTRNCLVG
jgi:uncharacterized protein with HEPN domain